MSFKHFLITRFNLRSEHWGSTKSGLPVLNDEWMEERLILFKKWCLPSVLNQSNKNFEWIIFLDNSTEQRYKVQLSQMIEPWKNILIRYINGDKVFDQEIHKILSKAYATDYCITTRLDNDDIVHTDFIDEIQKCAVGNAPLYIDIPTGYQLALIGSDIAIRNRYNPISTFSSFFASHDHPEHIFSRPNYEWRDFPNKASIELRLWVEVVHERNLVNDTKYDSSLTANFKFSDFGINYHWTPMDLLKIYMDKTLRKIGKSFKLK
jgi:glycosyltransferase involved in cell wall biosynthesis